jgi:multidrug efflux pump subunit AcrA (membrane-fusion protein)
MTQKRWDILIAAVVCAGLGLASGYYAATQSGPEAVDPHAGEAGPEPADHDHDHLGEETLQNLGVRVGTLQRSRSARTVSIVATVVETSRTLQPVQAPVDGVVAALRAEVGETVAAGAPVADLIRSGIPLPRLELTAGLIAPEHGEIHASIRELREAHADLAIAEAELGRIREFTGAAGAPVLPLQRRIDLEYAGERARVRIEIARHELERHGFSAAQVDGVAAGEHVPLFDAGHARRSLDHAGLWNPRAERLLAALPDEVATLPTAVGAVAELVAHGRVDERFSAWLEERPEACRHFFEIASLLLSGSGIDEVQRLFELGALAPRVAVRAPDLAPDWDVSSLHVRPGDRVLAGQALFTLRDGRALRLRLEPVGAEVARVEQAIAAALPCRALPLIEGTGPVLDAVAVDYLSHEAETGRVHGFARIDNRPLDAGLAETAGRRHRSWAIRPGLRYRVLLPTSAGEEVFELPRSAVTEDGPDRIVFVPTDDGDFEEVPVAVLFEDELRIVLAPAANPRLTAGQRIVLEGAFELGLAMHADEAGADHGHDH